jgi:hypothetical protein
MLVSKIPFSQTLTPGEIFQDKLYAYNKNNQVQTLFIHFDKNIYLTNESAWFAAYLIHAGNTKSEVLSISLVNHTSREIIKTVQFAIENDVSAGKISFPDSLKSGDYDLIAVTDLLNNSKPVAYFCQPIEIRSPYQQVFTVNFVADTNKLHSRIFIKTTLKDQSIAPEVGITYSVESQIGQIHGQGRTDKNGSYTLSIPDSISKYPYRLSVDAGLGNNAHHLSLRMQGKMTTRIPRFFPEGGNLVNGILTKVGFEITGTDEIRSPVKAILFSDGLPVDTIVTDSTGLGFFHIIPSAGVKMFVRIPEGHSYNDFDLPNSLTTGVAIKLDKGIVSNRLPVVITATGKSKYFVVIHNFREVFGVYETNFNRQSSTTLQVGLDNLPKGLATLTVLDESGRPVAERMFFAHSDRKPAMVVLSDNLEYIGGQPISLSISNTENTFNGLVSIACVNSFRIDPLKFTDIVSYAYLNHELSGLENTKNDSTSLEKTLLIKGWRKYTNSDVMKIRENDTIAHFGRLSYKGAVSKLNGKKMDAPASMSLFTSSGVNIISTGSNGDFSISNESLLTDSDSVDFRLVANADLKSQYAIKLDDPYKNILLYLLDSMKVTITEQVKNQLTPTKTYDTSDKISVLDAVVIHSRSGSNKSNITGYKANACGDFICSEEILNCPVHKPWDSGSHLPVKGVTYRTFAITNNVTRYTGSIEYKGCTIGENDKTAAQSTVRGIQIIKDFYMPVVKEDVKANTSTLYWESLKQVRAGDQYQTNISSGNARGEYLIIVQGLYNREPFFEEIKIVIK